jgi:NAD-dependent deacetylase sirtuin 4
MASLGRQLLYHVKRKSKGSISCGTKVIRSRYSVHIPKVDPVEQHTIDELARFISDKKQLLVITGAGCSTESGIPDYRGPNGSYSKGHKPVQYGDFVKNYTTRQRYWARNMLGWHFFKSLQPNRAHAALSELEKMNKLNYLITQNVDNLHQKAGNTKVLELHGTNYRVVCISCSATEPRASYQERLLQANPKFYSQEVLTRVDDDRASRPDGDAELIVDYTKFNTPPCLKCGGVVKPGVVMFGENLPPDVTAHSKRLADHCDGLLLVGTSVSTFSAYRLVLQAQENFSEIAMINVGASRADPLLRLKVEGVIGDVLSQAVNRLKDEQYN